VETFLGCLRQSKNQHTRAPAVAHPRPSPTARHTLPRSRAPLTYATPPPASPPPLCQVVDEAATARKQADADKKAQEKGEEPAKVEPVMKTDYEDVWGWRTQNDNKPIWTRNPKVRAGPRPAARSGAPGRSLAVCSTTRVRVPRPRSSLHAPAAAARNPTLWPQPLLTPSTTHPPTHPPTHPTPPP
jgi:hypothetical protein